MKHKRLQMDDRRLARPENRPIIGRLGLKKWLAMFCIRRLTGITFAKLVVAVYLWIDDNKRGFLSNSATVSGALWRPRVKSSSHGLGPD